MRDGGIANPVRQPAPKPTELRLDKAQFGTLPVFEGVGGGIIADLIDGSIALQFAAGSFVVRQERRLTKLYIVQRGILDLTHIGAAKECGVLLLSGKDVLLPGAALFSEPSLVSARALTPTRVIAIEMQAVTSALGRSMRFSNNLLKAMSGQWRMAVRNILDLNCRTASQRLGAFLLHIADLQDDAVPMLPIPKRHLAARLGMTPETLSRMLQLLANNGLHLRGRTIVIRDRAQVDRFCGPDPYVNRDETGLNVFAL